MTIYFTQNENIQLNLFDPPLTTGSSNPIEDEEVISVEVLDEQEDWDNFDSMSDAEALASAGFGTDEDYGYWGPGG